MTDKPKPQRVIERTRAVHLRQFSRAAVASVTGSRPLNLAIAAQQAVFIALHKKEDPTPDAKT